MNNKASRSELIKKKPKVILFYFSSLRSTLLYYDIIKKNPSLFDCVIEMPAIPYSKNNGKRNIKKLFRALYDSPGFFLMQLLVVKVYAILSILFKTSIKDLCKDNNLDHYFFKKIDKGLISFLKEKNPIWIISSTSTLLTEEFIKLPLNGVINFHEAPLPKYKGSASYFWFMVNNEKFAYSTVHYAVEKLDSGPIICEGPRVKVSQPTVFTLWFKMLLSHDKSWIYILPYLINGKKLPSKRQKTSNLKAYSYPDAESSKILKRKLTPFLNYDNLKLIFSIAFHGFKDRYKDRYNEYK